MIGKAPGKVNGPVRSGRETAFETRKEVLSHICLLLCMLDILQCIVKPCVCATLQPLLVFVLRILDRMVPLQPQVTQLVPEAILYFKSN